MAEYATGGYIEGSPVPTIPVSCDYIITAREARRLAEPILASLTSPTDEATDTDLEQRVVDWCTGYIAGIDHALDLLDDEDE